MGPLIELILRPIVLGLLIAFVILTIVNLIFDIKKKKKNNRTIILAVVCVVSVFLFLIAGRSMFPNVEKGNFDNAADTIIYIIQCQGLKN